MKSIIGLAVGIMLITVGGCGPAFGGPAEYRIPWLQGRRCGDSESFNDWLCRQGGPMRSIYALDSQQVIDIYRAEMGLPSQSLRCVSRRDPLGQIVTECR